MNNIVNIKLFALLCTEFVDYIDIGLVWEFIKGKWNKNE